MKASSFLNWKTALVLASVPFVAAWFEGASSSASADTTSANAPAASATAASADASTPSTTDATNTTDLSDAADASSMAPTSPMPAPAGMKLYGGTAEVVKLAQAGLSDDVILAYITNANVRFGVNSDQIVYLNDLGVSGTVVTAMMQHDATANAAAAIAPNTPSAIPPTTPAPGTDYANPPVPAMADNGMANLPPDNMNYTDSGAPYPDYVADDGATAGDTGNFYNPLQPYGNWVFVLGYGMCWQPTVCLRDHSWRPYCDRGRWLYSDCGWYWQSDYSWGWAAFHYGRWFCDDRRGWMWRPDRVWSPAWVAWRQSNEHCGWAPLPPAAEFVAGRGFRFHNHEVDANFDFGLRADRFTFIPIERFCDYAPGRYAVAPWQRERIFGQARELNSVAIQNNRVANLGMDPRLADERAGVRVRRALIQEISGTDANGRVQSDRLGRSGGSLVIYRPQLPAAPIHQRHETPGQNNFAPGTARNSRNSSPSVPDRTPTVLGKAGAPATPLAPGAYGDSHVRVYNVTHEPPKPAGTYPANSMVLDGRRNITNPQWNSTPNQTPSGTQNNNYRPGSSSSYTVTPGNAGQNQSDTMHGSRTTGNGSTAGYQQYGNPQYRTHVVTVAGSDAGKTETSTGENNRTWEHRTTPGSTYSPAQQPRQNYSPPVPRENYQATAPSYVAPQPRQNYAPPVPRENYTPPAPRQSYSPPAQSPPVPSHGASSYSQSQSSSSSSSGSQRNR